MPFNGSGVAGSPGRPAYPPIDGEVIYAAYFTQIMDDVYQMLSQVITRDGQSPASGNLPMAGKKHTGAANATANGEYLVYGQPNARIVSVTGVTQFLDQPTGVTGVDRTGGTGLATQQYVEVAAARAASEVIPELQASAMAMAVINYLNS